MRNIIRLMIAVFVAAGLPARSPGQTVNISVEASNALESVYHQASMSTSEFSDVEFIGEAARVSNAFAAAEGGLGIARVRSEVSYDEAESFYGLVSSTAYADWQDTLVIDSPGQSGNPGTADITFELTGSGYAEEPPAWGDQGEAFASYEFQFTINGFDVHPFGWWYGNGSFIGIPPIGVTNWTFSFTFGTPFNFDFWLRTHAHISGPGPLTGTARAHADFLREAHWLGIAQVLDQGNNVLTNFTVQSGSGVDWSLPVILTQPGVSNLAVEGGVISMDVDQLSLAFTNILQQASGLGGTNWQDVTTFTDTSGNTNVDVSVDSGAAFFRIESR